MVDVPVADDVGVAVGGGGDGGAAALEVDAGSHGDLASVGKDFDGGAVDDDGEGVGVAIGKRSDGGLGVDGCGTIELKRGATVAR